MSVNYWCLLIPPCIDPTASRDAPGFRFLTLLAAVGVLAGCATTFVAVTGDASVESLCQTAEERLNALVLWGPRWRADQKDVPRREEAARQGIDQFLSTSGCYASYEVRRVSLDKPLSTEDIQGFVAESKLKVNASLWWRFETWVR